MSIGELTKLKILFVASDSNGKLNTSEEYRSLKDVVAKYNYIELALISASRIEDFIKELNIFKPHIVHFTGHGNKDGKLGFIANDGVFGESISPESIKSIIEASEVNVRLFFLSACYSKVLGDFLSLKIDYIIGMNDKINTGTARDFSITFYESFFADIKIDGAFEQAKSILRDRYPNELSIPELLGEGSKEFKFSDIVSLNNTQNLKNTLVERYKKNFKSISLLIEDDKKPIDDIYVNLAIIIEEKEENIKDKSKLLKRDKITSSYEEIFKPKEPIAIDELIEKSSKSNSAKALIYGKAGIGKTTFCKYIAYKWSKKELYREFENIIYIPLREWKENSLKKFIQEKYGIDDLKENLKELKNTLFLFDGYDELKDTTPLDNEISIGIKNYIITSRPYGYRKSNFDVNEVFETIGFTDDNVTSYIDNFFQESSHKINLQNFLKQNTNIRHIAYIPLMLEMICWLWEEKAESNQIFSSTMTMTQLYEYIIENMMKKHEGKKKKHEVSAPYNRDYIKNYLGKIAFEGLINHQQNFDYQFLKSISVNFSTVRDEMIFFENSVIHSGFLKSNNEKINLLDNEFKFEFPHLTFQEYFSALYVSTLSRNEQKEIIKKWKFYPPMQMFFTFLAGLIKDKKLLLNKIEKKPKDILGFYSFLLILGCLGEINSNKLGESFQEKIIKELTYWIKIVFKENINHEVLLNRLPSISSFIDDKIIVQLINIIKDKNIYDETRKKVVKSITNLGKNDDVFLDSLIQLIRSSYIDNLLKINIVESLVNLDRKDDYFFKLLIKLIRDKNIYSSIRDKVAIPLSGLNEDNDELVINIFIEFLKDETTAIHRTDVVNSLIKLVLKYDKYAYILVNIIKDKNMHCGGSMAESLVKINKNDALFIHILLKIVTNNDINFDTRKEVSNSLQILCKNNDDFFITLITLVKNNNYFSKNKKIIKLEIDLDRSNKLFYFLIEMIRDKSIHPLLRGVIARCLVDLEISDDDSIKTLIESIKEDNEYIYYYIAHDIATFLTNSERSDDDFLDILIEIIKDESISISASVAHCLVNLNINNDYFIDSLFRLITDKDIDYYKRGIIVKYITKLDRNDNKILNFIIKMIKDYRDTYESSSYYLRIILIESLVNLDRNDDEVIKVLVDSVKYYKNTRRFEEARVKIMKFLVNSGRSDDEIFNTIIKFIKNEYLFNREETAESLMNLGRSDDVFLDTLIEIIKDEKIFYSVREKVVKSLKNTNRRDDKIIDSLFTIITDKNIHGEVKRSVAEVLANMSLDNTKVLEKVNLQKYYRIFMQYGSIKSFFASYGKNGITYKTLETKAFYDILPLYEKNNKLYTILEFQKIKTSKEVFFEKPKFNAHITYEATLKEKEVLEKWIKDNPVNN